MPREFSFEEFDELLEALSAAQGASAEVAVNDPEAARYARVLEYGSRAGQPPWLRPGPRTVLATDPETGATVVMSAQAPQGFIRIRAAGFLNQLKDELAQPADWLELDAVEEHLTRAVDAAARAALEELRSAVPRDTGRLSDSLIIARE